MGSFDGDFIAKALGFFYLDLDLDLVFFLGLEVGISVFLLFFLCWGRSISSRSVG
jgi:hypothetical protein